MKVVFTGDVFLGGDLNKVVNKNIIKSKTIADADSLIINLENPLSNSTFCADKGVLYAHPDSGENLRLWNVSAVNLANNHIQDKGNGGIEETLNKLESLSIGYFGAGLDISHASKPFYIKEGLCVLGFCQFDAPTLNIIQIASNTTPGVNPLVLSHVISSLDSLPKGTKAILHFHWGQEHLWLTQPDIILLSKKLLEHPQVELIIGMHPHRIQGKVVVNKKSSFLCLGNFLFPNFYFDSPAQLSYPSEIKGKVDVTYQYHKVSKLTYKKWRWQNRVSFVVEYDTETRESKIIPMLQLLNKAEVRELAGIKKQLVLILFNFLTFLNHLPPSIYNVLFKMNRFIAVKTWLIYNNLFWIKQDGLMSFFKRVRKKVGI